MYTGEQKLWVVLNLRFVLLTHWFIGELQQWRVSLWAPHEVEVINLAQDSCDCLSVSVANSPQAALDTAVMSLPFLLVGLALLLLLLQILLLIKGLCQV